MGISCNIIVRVRKHDIGKVIKFDEKKLNLPIDNDWYGAELKEYNPKPIRLNKTYVGMCCFSDGKPQYVGKSLLSNFPHYKDALNLVSCGCISYLYEDSIRLYNRKADIYEPSVQMDEIKNCWGYGADFTYIFDGGNWYFGEVDDNGKTINILELNQSTIEDYTKRMKERAEQWKKELIIDNTFKEANDWELALPKIAYCPSIPICFIENRIRNCFVYVRKKDSRCDAFFGFFDGTSIRLEKGFYKKDEVEFIAVISKEAIRYVPCEGYDSKNKMYYKYADDAKNCIDEDILCFTDKNIANGIKERYAEEKHWSEVMSGVDPHLW